MSSLNKNLYDITEFCNFPRSKFSRNHSHKTTFNEGQLVPFYVDEVLPGDTFVLDTTALVRMSTPVYPVMDNAYLDTFYFFVPNRLVWDHWKEFCGENTSAPWIPETEYTVPQYHFFRDDEWYTMIYNEPGMLGDYMGLPCVQFSSADVSAGLVPTVSALPFRAYYLIWNEWFRDQNYQYPVLLSTDDNDDYIGDELGIAQFGLGLMTVNRNSDYFSTVLPDAQKGPAVGIPLSASNLPVQVGSSTHSGHLTGAESYSVTFASGIESEPITENGAYLSVKGVASGSTGSPYLTGINHSSSVSRNLTALQPTNLWASFSADSVGTINQLRNAFAVQRMYEKDAYGTRYREILRNHFGVDNGDARMQIPEYLGGSRQPINMSSVVQTSSSDSVSPQGNVSGYSVTNDRSGFSKSFTEHGWIIGLCCVRVDHSYNQGINRMFTRKRRFDYYWPSFANIGNQAVMTDEIFVAPDREETPNVWGFRDAWDEYRYYPNRLSGLFKPYFTQPEVGEETGHWTPSPLSSWTYQDFYDDTPTMSDNWLREPDGNVGNTLAVQDEHQFIADFFMQLDTVRPMPVSSVPGLVDHF